MTQWVGEYKNHLQEYVCHTYMPNTDTLPTNDEAMLWLPIECIEECQAAGFALPVERVWIILQRPMTRKTVSPFQPSFFMYYSHHCTLEREVVILSVRAGLPLSIRLLRTKLC